MFKLIIFDLDGVLYDSKAYHFDALNLALSEIDEEFSIPFEEHVKKYDGLPTYKKLEMLTLDKGLDEKHYEDIWNNKQKYTLELLNKIEKDDDLISLLESFKSSDISLALASNSISRTVYSVIENLEVRDFFDVIVSNEDVKNSKPHPEMYWKCMSELSIKPNETLIIEDSPVGRLGASMSGANTYFVKSRSEVNSNLYNYVIEFDDKEVMYKLNQYVDKKLNILIPMAGKGSRFSEKGYVFPKPLIEIKGKPMIQVVVENINIDANYIFIVQKEHVDKYNIDKMLKLLKPDCEIVVLDGVTEGAASTTLMAKNYIDNESPLLIANSDQFIEWNPRESMYKFSSEDISGGILTFNATHPKWSYAKLNEVGEVIEYVSCAEEMIDKNIRVNNEFYVCPVYNQAIERKYKIVTSPIKKMWGIGTPEDLDSFLSEYQGSI